MKKSILFALVLACTGAAWSKLPAPVLTDEAKAKAAEAAAKTAHGNKVAAFQLCKSMDVAAGHYYKSAKAAGKETKPPTETPACADPGAFVWPAPATGSSPATVAAVKPSAKPPAAPAKK
jgi:hypothetical protein